MCDPPKLGSSAQAYTTQGPIDLKARSRASFTVAKRFKGRQGSGLGPAPSTAAKVSRAPASMQARKLYQSCLHELLCLVGLSMWVSTLL
jgi:hypothetical protein